MNARASDLRVERRTITHPDAARLVAQVQAEYVTRYGSQDDSPLDPDEFEPERGAFLVGYLDDAAVATGAWRWHDTPAGTDLGRCAELKRMYVQVTHRRRGLAARMLLLLEEDARTRGAEAMILETGTAQPEAISLYTTHGYRSVLGFGHYAWSPSSRCFAKALSARADEATRHA